VHYRFGFANLTRTFNDQWLFGRACFPFPEKGVNLSFHIHGRSSPLHEDIVTYKDRKYKAITKNERDSINKKHFMSDNGDAQNKK